MMKTNRMISMLFCAGILLGSSGTMQAMESTEEDPMLTFRKRFKEYKEKRGEYIYRGPADTLLPQFETRDVLIGVIGVIGGAVGALAAALGITIARAGYLIKTYGFKVMLTALNYTLISVNHFNLLI